MSFSHVANINEIDTAVFEGCGIRFPAIVGALIALVKAGIFNNIDKFAGSSGGAFPALFAALGMQPDEMVETINNMKESSVTSRIQRSQIPFFGTPFSIITKHGLHNSDVLIRFAENILKDRGFPPNLTFRQHAELKKKNPDRKLKSIYLTAVNNSTNVGELTVFSSENPLTQDVPIAKAFAAALAYPSHFTPVKILINGDGCEFTDGGTRDNYPYSIFPRDHWHKCLGFKLDTSEEIFGFHYHHPRLIDLFFWNLVTDNHFIFESVPNSVKFFDGRISTFKPLTLIDRQALYLSGELAMTARLTSLPTNSEKAAEHKSEVSSFFDPSPKASIDARTQRYLRLMENDSGLSGYIYPTYYFNLLMIYNELKSWKEFHDMYHKETQEFFVHYNALLDQLSENSPTSLSDVFLTGYALRKLRFDLFLLLRELADKAALFPEATPNLITAVVIAYLKTNDYKKAFDLLTQIDEKDDLKSKLIKLDHYRILQLLNQNKENSNGKKELVNLIELFYERLLKTYPGAYEMFMTVKFGESLQEKNDTKANEYAEKMKRSISDEHLDKIYDAATKQFESAPEQLMKLQHMLPTQACAVLKKSEYNQKFTA